MAILGEDSKRHETAVFARFTRHWHRVHEVRVLAGIAKEEFSSRGPRQHVRHRWRKSALDGRLGEAVPIAKVCGVFPQAPAIVCRELDHGARSGVAFTKTG